MTKTRQTELTRLYQSKPIEDLRASLAVARTLGTRTAAEHAEVIEEILDQAYAS